MCYTNSIDPRILRETRQNIAVSMVKKDERLLFYVRNPNAKIPEDTLGHQSSGLMVLVCAVQIIRELSRLEPTIRPLLERKFGSTRFTYFHDEKSYLTDGKERYEPYDGFAW
jgi:hypothetical protein